MANVLMVQSGLRDLIVLLNNDIFLMQCCSWKKWCGQNSDSSAWMHIGIIFILIHWDETPHSVEPMVVEIHQHYFAPYIMVRRHICTWIFLVAIISPNYLIIARLGCDCLFMSISLTKIVITSICCQSNILGCFVHTVVCCTHTHGNVLSNCIIIVFI